MFIEFDIELLNADAQDLLAHVFYLYVLNFSFRWKFLFRSNNILVLIMKARTLNFKHLLRCQVEKQCHVLSEQQCFGLLGCRELHPCINAILYGFRNPKLSLQNLYFIDKSHTLHTRTMRMAINRQTKPTRFVAILIKYLSDAELV